MYPISLLRINSLYHVIRQGILHPRTEIFSVDICSEGVNCLRNSDQFKLKRKCIVSSAKCHLKISLHCIPGLHGKLIPFVYEGANV